MLKNICFKGQISKQRGRKMKILHTSDLHLGKKLNGKITRYDEQIELLKEIGALCDSEGVDILLVAGDVFDTFIPAAEAEEIFFEFLNAVSSPSRAVVIISGNHDDWQRLSASSSLAGKYNAYIFGGENIPAIGGGLVKATNIGKNFVEIFKGEEGVYIGALPYLGEIKVGEKRRDISYGERVKEYVDSCFASNDKNLPQILLAHLFMLGGSKGSEERDIELGGARIVEPSCISDDIIYTALGHLHKRQIISAEKNVLYSGAPLQYAFDEVGHEKSVTLFEICNNSVQNLKVAPLKSGKQLAKIVAADLPTAKELLALYENSHVHLTLKLSEVLSEVESKELISSYPQLVDYSLEINSDMSAIEGEDRKKLNDRELFEAYYRKEYSNEVPDVILELYLKALSEEEL